MAGEQTFCFQCWSKVLIWTIYVTMNHINWIIWNHQNRLYCNVSIGVNVSPVSVNVSLGLGQYCSATFHRLVITKSITDIRM